MQLFGFVLPGSVAFADFGSTHFLLFSFVVGGTRGRFLCGVLIPEANACPVLCEMMMEYWDEAGFGVLGIIEC